MVSRNNSLLKFEIKGALELEVALRELGTDRLIRATLKRALISAAQPAVATAKSLAPRGPERGKPHMADKIAVSTTLSKRQRRARGWNSSNTAIVYIGAAPRGPAVLAEFGSGPRRHKNGKSVGSMPATPFMRPAWEQHKEQILRDFSRDLWVQIEKSAKRLAKRQMKAAGIR